MKVLHVSHHFAPCVGGVESYMQNAVKHLMKNGVECGVVCLNKCSKKKGVLPKNEIIDGVKVRRVAFVDLKYYKVAFGTFREIMNAKADLLHIHGVGFLSDWLKLTQFIHKTPIIISSHGGIFHTKKLSLLKKIYFFGWCRLLLRNTTVLAHSKNDFELFSKINKKVVMSAYAIDTKYFASKTKKDRRGLLFVGRVYKNKRIDRLVKTIGYLKEKFPDEMLTVVGSDWGETEKLKELAKERGVAEKVKFTGTVPYAKVAEYFGEADVFVSASEYEGFGISVVEAQAAGCIVFVNDITAFRNFITNGKDGFIVNFSDRKKATEKISEILSMGKQEKDKLRKKSIESAQKYSWENAIEDIIKVYRKVAKN